jgi:hypothetical protein
MKRLMFVLAVAGLLAVFAGGAQAQTAPQGTLDANNLGAAPGGSFSVGSAGIFGQYVTAQQFTAESTGTLTSAQVRLAADTNLNSLNGSLTMEITEVQASFTPAGNTPSRVLATTTIPAAEITDHLVTGVFSNPAPVVAGRKYALVLKSDSSSLTYRIAFSSNSYLGLDAWALVKFGSNPWGGYGSLDLIFATYVTPPPDTTAPATTATLSTQPNEAGWNNSDVTVRLSAEDQGGSGVEKITYSASGAQSIEQTDGPGSSVEVKIDQEGATTLTYYATDNEGNSEDPQTLKVKIDKMPPTANVSINGEDDFTHDTTVNLTLNSNDPSSGSGVAQMRFSNDGTSWSEWEPFATSKEWMLSAGDGEKTVYVQLKDRAGNESATAQDTIVLDQTAPSVSSTSPSNYATGVHATANISATFLEEGSGIDSDTLDESTFKVVRVKPTGNEEVPGTYSLNEESQTATFDPSNSLPKGLYRATITTSVKDKAGNTLLNDYTWTFATAGPPRR